MSSELRETKLIDLCSISFAYDRQVQSGCDAFDVQMYEIIDDTTPADPPQPIVWQPPAPPPPPTDLPTPLPPTLPPVIVPVFCVFMPYISELLDSTLIDILAWQMHVDFYDHTQPLTTRRELVFNSIQWHHRKGTVALLQEVLDFFFPGGATIQEWFEYMNPLPPNYPINVPDAVQCTFTSSSVNVPQNKFTIAGHGLHNNDRIRFTAGGTLPAPLIVGLWYYVVNATTNSFQLSTQEDGAVLVITSTGSGTNTIWLGGGSWHDRYRFRALIDERIIPPEDEAQALALINAYKPVSRWFEGFLRAFGSDCDIAWMGMALRFVYISSDAPDYP